MTSPDEFLAEFCHAIIIHDYHTVESELAPWLRAALPAGGIRKFMRLVRADAPPATDFTITPLEDDDATSMREQVEDVAGNEQNRSLALMDGAVAIDGPPSFPVPDELTDDNLRGVYRLEFQPADDGEPDGEIAYALYVAIVADGKDLKIGYIEPSD